MNRAVLDSFVFPGHPVTIAMMIMENFSDYRAASAMTKYGWPAALSSPVNGAGGAVYSALEVLKAINDEMPFNEAFDHASMLWKSAREGGDFAENLVEGQEKVEPLRTAFILQARA